MVSCSGKISIPDDYRISFNAEWHGFNTLVATKTTEVTVPILEANGFNNRCPTASSYEEVFPLKFIHSSINQYLQIIQL